MRSKNTLLSPFTLYFFSTINISMPERNIYFFLPQFISAWRLIIFTIVSLIGIYYDQTDQIAFGGKFHFPALHLMFSTFIPTLLSFLPKAMHTPGALNSNSTLTVTVIPSLLWLWVNCGNRKWSLSSISDT